MNDLTFDFMVDEVVDSATTTEPPSPAPHPWLSVLVLRGIHALFELGFEDDESASRIRWLLGKHAQMPRQLLAASELELLGRFVGTGLTAKLAEVARAESPHPLQQLATQLGGALGLDEAEISLCGVSLAILECRDIERAMDLGTGLNEGATFEVAARVAGISSTVAVEALSRPSLLRVNTENEIRPGKRDPSDHFNLPWRVAHLVKSGIHDVERIVQLFFRTAPPAELTLADFRGQSQVLEVIEQMVRGLALRPRKGVNVLIHGAPGTGKTQFVRALAEAVGARLLEVGVVDADGDPINPQCRISSLQSCLGAVARVNNGLVLLDEAEDIFPCEMPDFFGSKRSDRQKGWLIGVLEANPRPVFWLCNRIDQIDPAYLRRFDVVMEMRGPGRQARTQLVERIFEGSDVPTELREQLAGDSSFSPARLQKLACILQDLRVAGSENSETAVNSLLAELRRASGKPLAEGAPAIRFRPECVNADTDLIALSEALARTPEARVCLYGPPGTGKTEWARHVARKAGIELLCKRGSDLLGPYVGQTEARIAAAFSEAEQRGAMLLIDEADSFLHRRERAHARWEVGMVNEFLQALERYRGLCVVTTNFIEGLDPACGRRFDFKVRCQWLQAHQIATLFSDLVNSLGIETSAMPAALNRLRAAECLAPGDFANVARQNRVARLHSSPDALADALLHEVQFKRSNAVRRAIGFV